MTENDITFYLGDNLPTVYDAAIAIFSICKKPNSEKMKITIKKYVDNLKSMWALSFGDQHTLPWTPVYRKLELIVKDYYNQVYSKANRMKPKHKKEAVEHSSVQMLNRVWRNYPISDRVYKKKADKEKETLTNDYLLNIHGCSDRTRTYILRRPENDTRMQTERGNR